MWGIIVTEVREAFWLAGVVLSLSVAGVVVAWALVSG